MIIFDHHNFPFRFTDHQEPYFCSARKPDQDSFIDENYVHYPPQHEGYEEYRYNITYMNRSDIVRAIRTVAYTL